MAVNVKELRYAVDLGESGSVRTEDGTPLEPDPAWSPEHLLLAALVRCSLKSLRYHAHRAGLEVAGARGSARTLITRRESDGRYALVETEVELDGGEFRARAVLERACAAVADGFDFERVGIVRYVPETSTLVPFAGHGLTAAETTALPSSLPVAHFGAFQRALDAGRAIFVEDPSGDEP